MMRKPSTSYVVHGLVGGLLAVPVMMLTFFAAIPMGFVADEKLKLGIFWSAFVQYTGKHECVLPNYC